ncbi:UV excision repair protein rad23 [Entomophthora muscae]|uniref:UV excision repair protein rad23 n=1 Tax=Entomophthora muscae TaxID=34485 RepID=A0ACC2TZ80_9FUNG|nr:UV excision repair protein rad23 [Entomophthora muscae]
MQVRVKDLKNKEFKVTIEPNSTILELKQLIGKELDVPTEEQKLIYSGKILSNDITVEKAGISESGFVVCMISKKTKVQANTVPHAPVQNTPEVAAAPIPVPVPVGDLMRPIESSAPADLSDPSALVTGSEYEAAVNNFLEMGFEKELIAQAMRAAFNNPVRATEYLLNGIPDALVAEAAAPSVPGSTNAAQSPAPVSSETSGNLFQAAAQQAAARQQSGGDVDLSALRQSSQFQLIRQAIQENPSLLQPILSSLGAANPHLFQQISANPDAFLQLLNESEDESAGATLGSEDGGEGVPPPGQQYIQVTQEENDAISRLEALGFSRELVIQAYFACDKNEQLAANYLFDHGNDD